MPSSSSSRVPLKAINLFLNIIFVIMMIYMITSLVVSKYFPQLMTSVPKEIQAADKDLQAGKTSDAKALFDKYLAARPKDLDAFSPVIADCILRKQNNLAIAYAQQSVQAGKGASPQQQERLYLALSEAYQVGDKPQYALALEAAEHALRLAPDDPEALNAVGYTIAECRTDIVDLNRATVLIARALDTLNSQVSFRQVNPAEILDSYGWVLYKKGIYGPPADAAHNFARAVDALTQAVAGLPTDMPAEAARVFYYHLGAAFHKAGLLNQARNNIQIALRYDPKYPEALAEQKSLESEQLKAEQQKSLVTPLNSHNAPVSANGSASNSRPAPSKSRSAPNSTSSTRVFTPLQSTHSPTPDVKQH